MDFWHCKQVLAHLRIPALIHVEYFHRQLKSSLKSYPEPTNWTDILPVVLLGIYTMLKDDLHCTSAELVYGTTLRLPGEFFDISCTSDAVHDTFNCQTK